MGGNQLPRYSSDGGPGGLLADGTRIEIGHDDPTFTGHARLLLIGELIRRLQARRCGHVSILQPDPVSRRRQDLVIVRATWRRYFGDVS